MPINLMANTLATATAPATGGMSLIAPILMGLFSGMSGLLGESEKEKALRDTLDRLYAHEDYVKALPFTKDELFNKIFPIIKELNAGASDVAAGRLGAELGQTASTVGGGQNFADLYVQSLAPVIAEGQQLNAKALQGMVELYATMDDAAKRRLLSLLGLEAQVGGELPSLGNFQSLILNTLQGFDIGAKAIGNIDLANYFRNKKF